MDLLACPVCKNFPLQLIVFNKVNSVTHTMNSCDEYCSYSRKKIADLKNKRISLNCKVCSQINIVEGILHCRKCRRWYPIIEEIPHMLPDELRNGVEEIKFLIKNKEKIPHTILREGRPFNILQL